MAKYTAGAYLALLPIALFVGLPLLVSQLIAHAGTRPDEIDLQTTPSDLGVEFQLASFSSRDGLEIRGWYLPGRDNRPPIAFAHGLFRSRHEVLNRCCALNREGFPVLLFDLRGHGLSQKAPLSLGYCERLDVLGALDFLRSKTGQPQVVLAGVSMGAVASIMAAAADPDKVVAIVADSPFISLASTVQRHTWEYLKLPRFPFVPIFCWNLARIAGFPAEELDVAEALSGTAAPTLLIYGRDDPRMPPAVAQYLFDRVTSPERELFMVDGAGHGHAFQKDPESYVARIADFLRPASASNRSAQQLGISPDHLEVSPHHQSGASSTGR